MSDEIKSGSVVRLISGGPPLTVVSIAIPPNETEPYAFCTWFSGVNKDEEKTGRLPLHTLELHEMCRS